MASITRFLPKRVRERVKKDRERFEKAFNLPSGTLDKAEAAQQQRVASSVGATKSTPQTILDVTNVGTSQKTIISADVQQKVLQKQREERQKKILQQQREQRLRKFITATRRIRPELTTPKKEQTESINLAKDFATRFAGGRIRERPKGFQNILEKQAFDLTVQIKRAGRDKKKAKNFVERAKAQGQLAAFGFTDQILDALIGAKVIGVGAATVLLNPIDSGVAVKNFAEAVSKNPELYLTTAKDVTVGEVNRIRNDINMMARNRQGELFGRVGAEILLWTSGGKAFDLLRKGGKVVKVKVVPRIDRLKRRVKRVIFTTSDGRKGNIDLIGRVKNNLKRGVGELLDDINRRGGVLVDKGSRTKPDTPKTPKGATKTAGRRRRRTTEIDLRQEIVTADRKRIDSIVKKLREEFEKENLIKFDTARTEQIEKLIRAKLLSKLPKEANLSTVVRRSRGRRFRDSISRSIKRLRKFAKKKPKTKKKIIKKKKEVVDIAMIEAKNERKALDELVKKLRKEFEEANGIKFDTARTEQIEKLIRAKLKGKFRKSQSGKLVIKEKAKVIVQIRGAIRKFLKKIKKPFKPKKKQRVKVVDLRQIEAEINTKSKKEIVKRLREKLEEGLEIKFDTARREQVEKFILDKLEKGTKAKTIIDILNKRFPKSKIGKISKKAVKKTPKAKPDFKVRTVKTIQDFQDKVEPGLQQVKSNGQVLLQRTKQITIQQTKQKIKVKKKLKQKTKQTQKQLQLQKQAQKLRNDLLTVTKQIVKVRPRVVAALALVNRYEQKLNIKQKFKLKTKQRLLSRQELDTLQKLRSAQAQLLSLGNRLDSLLKQDQKLIFRYRQKLRTIQRFDEPKKRPLRVRRKPKLTPKKKKTTPQAYNTLAKPIKKRKLRKVNKVPLKKSDARDLRNYITDTSLSRTATIKPSKGKPRKSKLRVPKGYAGKTAKKFRRYRIVKGKRKLLPKGKVIERTKRLLDTRGERKQISLARRIKQITIKKKPKKNTKKAVKRPKMKKKVAKKTRIRPQSRSKRTLSKKGVKSARKVKKARKKTTKRVKRR